MRKRKFVKELTTATFVRFESQIAKCINNGTEMDLDDLMERIIDWVEDEILKVTNEYTDDIGCYAYMIAEHTVGHVRLVNYLSAYLTK